MLIHADYMRRATVVPGQHRWSASPQGGVERMMLDRFGGERARATSLVRYAPGAHFPAHQHPGGEEILVLSGTFLADGEHYPAGSYLRNPPGSRHQPSSPDGALIFVKLWQMTSTEHDALRIDTRAPVNWIRHAELATCFLFNGPHEQVRLLRMAAGAALTTDNAELLVLDGALQAETLHYPRHSWLRLPPGDTLPLHAGPHGATVYLKTGHLAYLNNLETPC